MVNKSPSRAPCLKGEDGVAPILLAVAMAGVLGVAMVAAGTKTYQLLKATQNDASRSHVAETNVSAVAYVQSLTAYRRLPATPYLEPSQTYDTSDGTATGVINPDPTDVGAMPIFYPDPYLDPSTNYTAPATLKPMVGPIQGALWSYSGGALQIAVPGGQITGSAFSSVATTGVMPTTAAGLNTMSQGALTTSITAVGSIQSSTHPWLTQAMNVNLNATGGSAASSLFTNKASARVGVPPPAHPRCKLTTQGSSNNFGARSPMVVNVYVQGVATTLHYAQDGFQMQSNATSANLFGPNWRSQLDSMASDDTTTGGTGAIVPLSIMPLTKANSIANTNWVLVTSYPATTPGPVSQVDDSGPSIPYYIPAYVDAPDGTSHECQWATINVANAPFCRLSVDNYLIAAPTTAPPPVSTIPQLTCNTIPVQNDAAIGSLVGYTGSFLECYPTQYMPNQAAQAAYYETVDTYTTTPGTGGPSTSYTTTTDSATRQMSSPSGAARAADTGSFGSSSGGQATAATPAPIPTPTPNPVPNPTPNPAASPSSPSDSGSVVSVSGGDPTGGSGSGTNPTAGSGSGTTPTQAVVVNPPAPPPPPPPPPPVTTMSASTVYHAANPYGLPNCAGMGFTLLGNYDASTFNLQVTDPSNTDQTATVLRQSNITSSGGYIAVCPPPGFAGQYTVTGTVGDGAGNSNACVAHIDVSDGPGQQAALAYDSTTNSTVAQQQLCPLFFGSGSGNPPAMQPQAQFTQLLVNATAIGGGEGYYPISFVPSMFTQSTAWPFETNSFADTPNDTYPCPDGSRCFGVPPCPTCQRNLFIVISNANAASCQAVGQNRISLGCFDVHTKVRMGDGSTREIVTVKAGDEVWNPVTKKPAKVTWVSAGMEKTPLMHFRLDDGEELRITKGHPVPTQTGVRRAADVHTGDSVQTEDGHWHVLVDASYEAKRSKDMVINLKINPDSIDPRDHMLDAGGIITGDLYLQEQITPAAKTAAFRP